MTFFSLIRYCTDLHTSSLAESRSADHVHRCRKTLLPPGPIRRPWRRPGRTSGPPRQPGLAQLDRPDQPEHPGPICASPNDIVVIVAGGGGRHSAWMSGWVTRVCTEEVVGRGRGSGSASYGCGSLAGEFGCQTLCLQKPYSLESKC